MSLQFFSSRLARCCFQRHRHSCRLSPSTPFLPSNEISSYNNGVVSTTVRTFASKKHKNLLKHTKGFRGRSKNCFRVAIRRLQKSWQYAYRDRRRKRREWSKLWIQRIQAGVRQYSWRYSQFMGCYKQSGMQLDRKSLAELAANEPFAFRSVVQVVEHTSSNGGNKIARAG
mmetsp:Transcript_2800/g.5306  ORF Transcript_2800/g.5306 Transcript_2800/m.5306 type:complete len:171 (+) Transcript_2800:76-588(+)